MCQPKYKNKNKTQGHTSSSKVCYGKEILTLGCSFLPWICGKIKNVVDVVVGLLIIK
jgi:hypothetical protein